MRATVPGLMPTALLVVVATVGGSRLAAAETLLGQETDADGPQMAAPPKSMPSPNPSPTVPDAGDDASDDASASDATGEARQAPDAAVGSAAGSAAAAKAGAKPQPTASRGFADESEHDDSHFTFAGALGAGSGYVNAQATFGYYINDFVGLETSYYYYQFSSDAAAGQQYGPEIDAVFRLANPWILTPFAGLGPGYTQWHRTYNGTVFDKGNSYTANQFLGVDLRLTPHFGIEVMRKQQVYLNARPISFDDRVSHEARSSWSTNIGFRVVF